MTMVMLQIQMLSKIFFLTILEKIEELRQIVSKYLTKKVSAAKKKKKNETTLRTTKKTFQNEELPH